MDMKKQAKIDVLKELMQAAKDSHKSSVKKGLDEMKAQKVTVAAPDKKSLLEGLEKAEDVLESSMPESEVEEMESSEEEKESEDMPSMEDKEVVAETPADAEDMLKSMMMEDEDDYSVFSAKSKKKKEDSEEDDY